MESQQGKPCEYAGARRTGREGAMEDMGMTDTQFKAFIRSLLRSVEDAKAEQDTEKKDEKLKGIADDLRATLED